MSRTVLVSETMTSIILRINGTVSNECFLGRKSDGEDKKVDIDNVKKVSRITEMHILKLAACTKHLYSRSHV